MLSYIIVREQVALFYTDRSRTYKITLCRFSW